MARATSKKKKVDIVEKFDTRDVNDVLHEAMGAYSKAAIERHIPDGRDGLKPVQRRCIYTMYINNFVSTRQHVKVALAAGQVMALHPHGDSSIDSALVRLSQPWVYNTPFVDIEGNNGSIDGSPAAASRYIEGRLTKEAEIALDGIKEKAVKMIPNYDNTRKEPSVLPAHYPILFTNGASGMGVGISTNVAPHNPRELLKASELLNRKPEATLGEVMRIVKGPDFPTGGSIIDRDAIKRLYVTGKSSLPMRAKAEIEGQSIVITEIPFGNKITSGTVLESMWDAVEKHNLNGRVTNIQDEGENGQTRLVVYTKRGEDPQIILNILYKYSQLQANFSANHMMISNGTPKQTGLLEYLHQFLDFKREVVRNIYNNELENKSERLHIVEGFIRAVSIIDKVVALIRKSSGRADSIEKLQKTHKFTEAQATAIVSMRLHQLSNQDITELKKEEKELNDRIKWINGVLNDDTKFTEEISRQLNETANHFSGYKRKTIIDVEAEEIVVDATDLVRDQETIVVVKPTGAQRMSKTVYTNNKDSYKGEVIATFDTSTSKAVVMLTKNGRVIQRLANDLENSSIKNDVDDIRRSTSTFKSDDEIVGSVVFDVDDVENLGLSVVSITKLGQVKHSPLNKSLFVFTQKGYMTRTGAYNGLKLEGDEVIFHGIVKTEDVPKISVTLKRNSGGRKSAVHFKDYREQGATGSGASAMKITKEGDYVEVVNHNIDKYLVK